MILLTMKGRCGSGDNLETMIDESKKLKQIIDVGLEIAHIKDVDMLLERILTEARTFVNADAGSIFVVEEGALSFRHAQNETLQKRLEPGKKLIYATFTVPINNRSIAGYVAESGAVLNIPDVSRLPEGVPYRFDRRYDERSSYATRSMLTLPLESSRGDIIGVLQLINARDAAGGIIAFSKEDEPYIEHFAHNAARAIERAQITRAIILRMIGMAELRDPKETGAHVNRVASYSVEIYEHWARMRGISTKEIDKNKDLLRMAAMLHDVGKVAIPDAILKKPGKLTQEEFEIIKHHTFLGARLFATNFSDFDEAACIVALSHHERWDGNGYPGYVEVATGQPMAGYEIQGGKARGKKGEEIHPFGRVTAIADVYDALASKRSYKEPWDEDRIMETLRKDAGTHFDPEMIASFFSILDVIKMIAERYPGD